MPRQEATFYSRRTRRGISTRKHTTLEHSLVALFFRIRMVSSHWLRRELPLVSDEESEVFKEWEMELLRKASFYDGDVESGEGGPRETRIFEDQIEAWEQNAIDGTGDGERIPLSRVRRDHAAKFRLNEKYK